MTSGLLRHAGLELSEPMALGLGNGITFAHFPFFKVGGLPLTSYRMPPGMIYKTLSKMLGFTLRRETFRSPDAGAAALDAHLAAGRPVGAQTSVFWLPYFPPTMRFHFNAHNLIVYGRDGGEYPGNYFRPEKAEEIGVAFIQAAHAAKQMPRERPIIRSKATA